MKTIKNYFKPISYLLAFIIFFQGCTVYRTQNLSMEEAAATKDMVKLITKQNKTHHYLYISKDGDKYYGVKEVNDQLINMQLYEENVTMIRAKDNRASKTATIIIGITGGLAILLGIWYLAAKDTAESLFDFD